MYITLSFRAFLQQSHVLCMRTHAPLLEFLWYLLLFEVRYDAHYNQYTFGLSVL